ncbi:MAG: type II secretion system protein GspJ [Myxococcota bacterium]
MDRARRGFTLLEVLVAIAVVGLVGMLIYGSFRGMNRSRDNMQTVNDRYQQGRQALDRMARELSGAYLSLHQPLDQRQFTRQTIFTGKSQNPTDRLDFTAFAGQRLKADSHVSDQVELSYFAAPDPTTGRIDLVRRADRYLDLEPDQGGIVQVMVEDIVSFDVRYLDPLTFEWVDDWDTTQAAGQLNRLPAQVWVQLVVNDQRIGQTITFETKTTLPIQLPLDFATK